MSDDKDIERLVEKQARGESPGVPVEGTSFESGQLDTRRSKSAFAASTLFGQNVDVPGAEVDSQSYIAQQTGIIVDGVPPDLAHHMPVADPSAQNAVETSQGVVDANQYPDVVDQPSYIQAHSNPALVQDDATGLAELRTPETEIQIGPDQPG